jgi:hypothetical protein
MEVANTQAYYDRAAILVVKCFIVKAPGPNVKNFLGPLFMNFSNNLECLSLLNVSSLVQYLCVRLTQ